LQGIHVAFTLFSFNLYIYICMRDVDLICWYLMLLLFACITFVVICTADMAIKHVCFKEKTTIKVQHSWYLVTVKFIFILLICSMKELLRSKMLYTDK